MCWFIVGTIALIVIATGAIVLFERKPKPGDPCDFCEGRGELETEDGHRVICFVCQGTKVQP